MLPNPEIYRPADPIHWTFLRMKGPDAADFLHRLTTVDVRNLKPGSGSPGFFLTAQGRVRAYFTLWRLAEAEFAFEFDAGSADHWKTGLLAAIDQYTFSERFELEPKTEAHSVWIFGTAAGLADFETRLESGARVFQHGAKDFGRKWISLWGSATALEDWLATQAPGARSVEFSRLESWRIEAVRPRADAELTETSIPLEIGLNEAIAQNKGCYPGQEVIEKIISLGSPPRRMVRIEGQGEPPAPEEKIQNLADPAADLGQITSVEATGTGFAALGIVRKVHAKEGMEVQLAGTGTQARIVRVAPYE